MKTNFLAVMVAPAMFLFAQRIPATEPWTLDPAKTRPVQFLKMLREKCCEQVTVYTVPKGWITEADVRELEKYIHDTRPAAPVYNPVSSGLCAEKSTVGREALYLIEGYKQKRYPSELCSTHIPDARDGK